MSCRCSSRVIYPSLFTLALLVSFFSVIHSQQILVVHWPLCARPSNPFRPPPNPSNLHSCSLFVLYVGLPAVGYIRLEQITVIDLKTFYTFIFKEKKRLLNVLDFTVYIASS